MITSKNIGAAAIGAALCFSACAPTEVQARDFFTTVMRIDLATGTARSQVYGVSANPVELSSARDIQDGAFTYLDLEFALTGEEVQKMVDQGFSSEPSGCVAGEFGPLDMEDGLRYFTELEGVAANTGETPERVRITVYPGNRSTHWTNDVSCEYDEMAGGNAARLRISGYFFVIHRQLQDGVDVQLRAVTVTENETEGVQQQLALVKEGRSAIRGE